MSRAITFCPNDHKYVGEFCPYCLLDDFKRIYEAQRSGAATVSNQGQAMDGFSALANYNGLASKI